MRIILSTVFFISIICLQAQEYCPSPFGRDDQSKKYHITAGVGLTRLYGEIAKPDVLGRAFFLDFDYSVSKGFYVGLSSQLFGRLEALSSLVDLREVGNNYTFIGGKLTLHPFELFSDDRSYNRSFFHRLKNGLYVGVGAGYVFNNYDSVYRDLGDPGTFGAIESFDENNEPVFYKRTTSLIVPSLNFGIVMPIGSSNARKRSWSLVLNAQLNYANNDLLDGYLPYTAEGRPYDGDNDNYNFYSAGLRYSF